MGPQAPLFLSQHGGRLSKRRTQQFLELWQRRAGFDRVYGFHCLRRSAITNVYRATKDVLVNTALRAAFPPRDDDGVHASVR